LLLRKDKLFSEVSKVLLYLNLRNIYKQLITHRVVSIYIFQMVYKSLYVE